MNNKLYLLRFVCSQGCVCVCLLCLTLTRLRVRTKMTMCVMFLLFVRSADGWCQDGYTPLRQRDPTLVKSAVRQMSGKNCVCVCDNDCSLCESFTCVCVVLVDFSTNYLLGFVIISQKTVCCCFRALSRSAPVAGIFEPDDLVSFRIIHEKTKYTFQGLL